MIQASHGTNASMRYHEPSNVKPFETANHLFALLAQPVILNPCVRGRLTAITPRWQAESCVGSIKTKRSPCRFEHASQIRQGGEIFRGLCPGIKTIKSDRPLLVAIGPVLF
jgi:hypothetical protein